MLKAKHGKEIVVKVTNRIGVLADLSRIVAEKGINILAASAWAQGDTGLIRLVTDDNLRAGDALRKNSYQPQEVDVVLTEVPHKPGMMRHIAETLAKKDIDLHHLYASAIADETKCLIVFSSADNDRAVVLLNE